MVDAATVLSTHLTELIKTNVSELLSYAEVVEADQGPAEGAGELIKDIVPAQITVSGIQRVLQIAAGRAGLDPRPRHHPGRHRRRDRVHAQPGHAWPSTCGRGSSRQLCAQYTTPAGHLPLIALTARWEQTFAESIIGQGDDRTLAMQPSRLTEFITLVRERFEDAARSGEAPVLVTSASAPAVRAGDRRAVPGPDPGHVAERNPPADAAQDRRKHLSGAVEPA